MRKILLTVQVMLCVIATKSFAETISKGDSAKIVHTLDGNISEWKIEKFEADKETNIYYAVDHDADNLYLAIKVPDQRIQMKMMMMGMNVYVDKKGKRKEGTGVEFPIKKEGGQSSGFSGGRRGGGQDEAPDPKAMREKLSANMIFLKTFGFDDQDKTQLITQPNGINIAFDWDNDNVLYIEYLLPMSLFGKAADLNGKPLGIGWKINGASMPSSSGAASVPGGDGGGRGGGGGSRGGGGGGSRGGGSPAPAATNNDSMFKDQYIWTKYNLIF